MSANLTPSSNVLSIEDMRDNADDPTAVANEIRSSSSSQPVIVDNLSYLSNGFHDLEMSVNNSQLAELILNDDSWIHSNETLPWTTSKIASYNVSQKLFRCNECECVGYLSRIAEHWLGSHSNLRVFQCALCSYASAWARCVKMHLARQHDDFLQDPQSLNEDLQKLLNISPTLEEVTRYLEKLQSKFEVSSHEQLTSPIMSAMPEPPPQLQMENGNVDHRVATVCVKLEPDKCSDLSSSTITAAVMSTAASGELYSPTVLVPAPPRIDTVTTGSSCNLAAPKRYHCVHCSYATDRKDLFTRHENIHREEKPFQCNVCQKQFNRADHIKKHFIRIHRDHEYVLSKVRRPKSQYKPSPISLLTQNISENNANATSGFKRIKNDLITTASPSSSSTQQSSMDTIIQRSIPTTVLTHTIHHQLTTTSSHDNDSDISTGSVLTRLPQAAAISDAELATTISTIKTAPPNHMQEFSSQQSCVVVPQMGPFETHTLLIKQETASEIEIPTEAIITTIDTKQKTIASVNKSKKNSLRSVQCDYCTWTGVDNWCLKRHLNTHLRPYLCTLCEYKAARSERLTTHIFRVHNKRACTKCNFLANDLTQLTAHQTENHKGMKSRKKSKNSEMNRAG